jgi:hypothetical protein
MTKPETPTKTETKAPAASGWKKRAVHENVQLPSGQVVSLKLPNLAQLLKAGAIPNDLVEATITFAREQPEISREVVEQEADFLEWLIPAMIVEPEVTSEDVPELPSEDLQMLAQFAARNIDQDAVGNHLGGLHTNRDWRRFRQQLTIEEIAEDMRADGEVAA